MEYASDGTNVFFRMRMAVDNKARRANTERLRELVASHSDEVTVFCAHDKTQYDALAGR